MVVEHEARGKAHTMIDEALTVERTQVQTRGERTRALRARQDAVVYPAVGRLQLYGDEPLAVDRASGMYLYDVEGNRYLDFFGGILTVSVGHCNEEVTEATIRQLKRAQHTSTLFVNEAMVAFAEKMRDVTPGDLSVSFFTSSGSEANETAIMTA